MPFKALGIADPILKALREEGYSTPTPIQAQAIPIVLRGKDLLGVAQTGTGKTAAFSIPIIQILSETPSNRKRRPIRALILTPTRELAVQIDDSIKAYGRHSKLSTAVIFGGVSQGAQTQALKRGVDIVVATPGRLMDLMDQGYLDLREIEIFVLDEADRMLDMGFVRDVKKILHELPRDRQSLFFSATMPPAIQDLAQDILFEPEQVEIKPVAATVDLIDQSIYFVEKSKKQGLLMHLLEEMQMPTALVFTRTKHGADHVVRTLTRNRISAEAIHGNKAQNARQRALNNFKAQKTRVLVATDIAARGIDVDELEYVINFEIPNVPETYVHRIGRTGRAGAAGVAISFCSPDEKTYLRDIEKLIKRRIPIVHEHPFGKGSPSEAPVLEKRSEGGERRQGFRGIAEQSKAKSSGRRGRGGPDEAPRGARAPRQDGSPAGERRRDHGDASERPRAPRTESRGPRSESRGEHPTRDGRRPQPHAGERPARDSGAGSHRPAKPQGAAAAKKKVPHGKRRRRPTA